MKLVKIFQLPYLEIDFYLRHPLKWGKGERKQTPVSQLCPAYSEGGIHGAVSFLLRLKEKSFVQGYLSHI